MPRHGKNWPPPRSERRRRPPRCAPHFAGEPARPPLPPLPDRWAARWQVTSPALRPFGEKKHRLGDVLFHRAFTDAKASGNFPALQFFQTIHKKNLSCSWRQLIQPPLHSVETGSRGENLVLQRRLIPILIVLPGVGGITCRNLLVPVTVDQSVPGGPHQKSFGVFHDMAGAVTLQPQKRDIEQLLRVHVTTGVTGNILQHALPERPIQRNIRHFISAPPLSIINLLRGHGADISW